MSANSPAVDGSNYAQSRPLSFAFNGSGGASVGKALAAGSYYFVAETAGAWCVVGSGAQTAVVPQTTQQAATHASARHFYCPVGVAVPVDIEGDSWQMAALGATTTAGTLHISGPLGRSSHG